MAQSEKPYILGIAQFFLLSAICKNEGKTAAQIHQALTKRTTIKIDERAIRITLDGLQKKGFVKKEWKDADSRVRRWRRYTFYSATEEGVKLVHQYFKNIEALKAS